MNHDPDPDIQMGTPWQPPSDMVRREVLALFLEYGRTRAPNFPLAVMARAERALLDYVAAILTPKLAGRERLQSFSWGNTLSRIHQVNPGSVDTLIPVRCWSLESSESALPPLLRRPPMRGDPRGDYKANTGLTARPRLTKEGLAEIMGSRMGSASISMTQAKRLEQEILALWEWQDAVLTEMRAIRDAKHDTAMAERAKAKAGEEITAAQDRLRALMEVP